jgi:hypothetical protein
MLTPRQKLVTKTHYFRYKNAVIRLMQGEIWTDTCQRYSKHLQTTAQGVLEDRI